ncbi:melanization protease 1-like isoform X2 [Cydia pomonella]|uniref:melanization protease 1-like isoform X2 n=1 Tax=Cydia pomonella TaxID=82600 RepID=UPI002ADDEE61|nr:melanization protease 1-like isoform X2 [Cydia pomonella]
MHALCVVFACLSCALANQKQFNLTATTPNSVESVENHPNLGLLPDTCGMIKETKLLGGRSAELYAYPWMALISYKTRLGPQFECSGSLINERYVLTAAHCISNLELLGVRIGEHDVDTTSDCQGEPPTLTCESKIQDIRIEEAIPHPEYHGKPNIKNDIGIIRLKKPVDLSFKNAGIICLPVSKDLQSRNLGGQHATVAGWGYTEKGYVSSKLLAVDVLIHTAESCLELFNRGRKPGEEDETINKICAGEIGKNSCIGDLGGPLMVRGAYKNNEKRFIQHGIMSYGPRLCASGFPGVYTDVPKYMKWILDNIRP